MASMGSKKDYQVAALAAGFTIGFGFLTVWEAIKQTRQNKNPARSAYIYMIWGEIAANVALGIVAWLFLDGTLKPTVPTFFFIVFFWVFQIQLLMQIIINRISVIAESRKTVQRVKWGTALIITLINIAVFCIFIPAHIEPPLSPTFVEINKYWDPTSKVLILLVDAGLNWYFLKIVKDRLLTRNGLVKYKPLVSFNAKLMILSIAMDGLLIGLMWYPNQLVFVQFHPVTYIVKLNIEMSMASLIARLAASPSVQAFDSFSDPRNRRSRAAPLSGSRTHHNDHETRHGNSIELSLSSDENLKKMHDDKGGIHRQVDVEVRFDSFKSVQSSEERLNDTRVGARYSGGDDEVALTNEVGALTSRGIPRAGWDATTIPGGPGREHE